MSNPKRYFFSYAFKYKHSSGLGFGSATTDDKPWELIAEWNDRYGDERSFVLLSFQDAPDEMGEVDSETHLG